MTSLRKRPYYGWLIVGMAVIAIFVPSGFSQLFTGVMLKPITEDMGWTRTMTAGAITAGTIIAGLLSPLVGRLADRYGARFLMPFGALLSAGAYLALAHFTSLWQFYASYILGRGVASTSNVVSLTAVVNWFRRRRGTVIGIVAMSMPLWGSAQAFVGQYIISYYGWRAVYRVFGAFTLVFTVVPPILIMRRRPEDMGLLPDGDVEPEGEMASSLALGKGGWQVSEHDWTLGEVIRTRTFWLIIVGQSMASAAIGGVLFHFVAYLTDMGISATAAAGALSILALFGAFGNVILGVLSDWITARITLIFALFLAAVMVGVLLTVRSAPMAYVVAALFGFAARGEGSPLEIMIAQYFGRASFGSIIGFMAPFQMVGLGFGPLIAAAAFDLTGSYQGVFTGYVGLYLIACLNMVLAKAPKLPVRDLSPAVAKDKG